MVMGMLWGGYGEVMGRLWGGYGMVMGMLWGGYGEVSDLLYCGVVLYFQTQPNRFCPDLQLFRLVKMQKEDTDCKA